MSIVRTLQCNKCGRLFEQVTESNASDLRKIAAKEGWTVAFPRFFALNIYHETDYTNLPEDENARLDKCSQCSQPSR